MTFLQNFPYGMICGPIESTFNFINHCDDEEQFKQHLKTQPIDWIYRTLPVEYKYNSLGFRCDDHKELTNDYILFSGCSLTEGSALPIEHTYPYLISKALNKTYYNLALAGTGPWVLQHNMMLFMSLMKDKKPDIVVIQWPDFSRCTFFSDNGQPALFNGSSYKDPVYKVLLESEFIENTNQFYRYGLIKFLQNLGIKKIIEIYQQPLSVDLGTSVTQMNLPPIDYARDLSHPGIESHKCQAEAITNIIK